MKMLFIVIKFWGFSQAFGLRSSIHCFFIRLDASFPMQNISNQIQQQARILPSLTQFLQCRYTVIHLAGHCSAVNRLLPDDPIFLQLCSDLMLYMAHNCAGNALYQHLCSIWALSSIIETVPQVAYAALFCIFYWYLRPLSVEGPDPSTCKGLNMQKNKNYWFETWGSTLCRGETHDPVLRSFINLMKLPSEFLRGKAH